ncbi:MAG: hypothetical protein U0Q22_02725 [Acidimicrobiales bacterium]
MRRIQLFEFEDQRWLPWWVREEITDHLARVFTSSTVEPLHRAMADRLAGPMERTGTSHLVDLCSGAGGPLPAVLPLLGTALGRTVTATFTDLYPHRHPPDAIGGETAGMTIERHPVDARSMPPELDGMRSVFNAIHHFTPDDVADVLRGATRGGRSIAIFEPFERRAGLAATVALGGLLAGWRNARAARGPARRVAALHAILPVVLGWDAAVSVLRGYRADELLEIAQRCGADDRITWSAERMQMPWGHLTVLVGDASAVSP